MEETIPDILTYKNDSVINATEKYILNSVHTFEITKPI